MFAIYAVPMPARWPSTRAVSKCFPEGTRVTQPRGGFVIWVELPKAVDALSLCQ